MPWYGAQAPEQAVTVVASACYPIADHMVFFLAGSGKLCSLVNE